MLNLELLSSVLSSYYSINSKLSTPSLIDHLTQGEYQHPKHTSNNLIASTYIDLGGV